MSAAHEIRDDIVAQDLRVRRVVAGLEIDIEVRMKRLEQDLVALLQRIDPAGTSQVEAQQRRLKKFEQKARELTATAYAEVAALVDDATKRITKAEAQAVAQILEKHIP